MAQKLYNLDVSGGGNNNPCVATPADAATNVSSSISQTLAIVVPIPAYRKATWVTADLANCADINISTGKREPAEFLNDPDKLLVANWAWDANSFVGNEYWDGMLATSGDPAAASCSFVAYLGNPYVCHIDKIYAR